MTRFKICGLRDVGNAVVAADSGADHLGFNFVPGVRRQITPDQAKSIIDEYRDTKRAGGPRLVGLFADQPVDEVNRVAQYCGLDVVQLCGSERPEYWADVSLPIIKQIKVGNDGSAEKAMVETLTRVEEVLSYGHFALLDRYEKGALGGTGLSFDWSIAREVAERHNVVLAGGLTPDNVGEAISGVAPWGVDVSSGVETDGIKDPDKIVAFAAAVRKADTLSSLENASARAPSSG